MLESTCRFRAVCVVRDNFGAQNGRMLLDLETNDLDSIHGWPNRRKIEQDPVVEADCFVKALFRFRMDPVHWGNWICMVVCWVISPCIRFPGCVGCAHGRTWYFWLVLEGYYGEGGVVSDVRDMNNMLLTSFPSTSYSRSHTCATCFDVRTRHILFWWVGLEEDGRASTSSRRTLLENMANSGLSALIFYIPYIYVFCKRGYRTAQSALWCIWMKVLSFKGVLNRFLLHWIGFNGLLGVDVLVHVLRMESQIYLTFYEGKDHPALRHLQVLSSIFRMRAQV